MRSRMARSVLSLVGLLCATAGCSAAQMPWEESLDAALSKAKNTGQLVMADFYTDW